MRPQSSASIALLEIIKDRGKESLARKTCSVQTNCNVCKDSTRLPLKPDWLSRASAENLASIWNPKLKPSFDFLVIRASTSAIIWPSLFSAWHLSNYYSCSRRHLKHLPRVTDFVKIIGLELSSVTILQKIYVKLTESKRAPDMQNLSYSQFRNNFVSLLRLRVLGFGCIITVTNMKPV